MKRQTDAERDGCSMESADFHFLVVSLNQNWDQIERKRERETKRERKRESESKRQRKEERKRKKTKENKEKERKIKKQ